MKTSFTKRAASLALLSTVLISCGKDNNVPGAAATASTTDPTTVSGVSVSSTSANFASIIANSKCDSSIATKKFFAVSIQKTTQGTPSSLNVASISDVNFTDAKTVMVGKEIKTVSGASLEQYLFVKETSSTFELYHSLCLPNLAYGSSTSISYYSYPRFPIMFTGTNANSCPYSQLADFQPTIGFNNGAVASLRFDGSYCK